MKRFLFPRLQATEATTIFARFAGKDLPTIARAADGAMGHPRVTYAAVGGERIPISKLEEIQAGIRRIAGECGYPGRRTLQGQQKLDTALGKYLHSEAGLIVGEALRSDVWQYLCAVLVPDVVVWRWRGADEDREVKAVRYLGGARNSLGRLWLRAEMFRDDRLSDPWLLHDELNEDNFVGILERSRFARFPAGCREVARAFLLRRDAAKALEDVANPAQLLVREAMLRITRLGAFVSFASLDEGELAAVVGETFDLALKSIGGVPEREAQLLTYHPELRRQTIVRRPVSPSHEIGASMLVGAETGETAGKDFYAMNPDERSRAVWEAVIGQPAMVTHELIETAADGMRKRGQVSYERLRRDGVLYTAIAHAIDSGLKVGWFISPARGQRQAVVTGNAPIPSWLWARELKRVVEESGNQICEQEVPRAVVETVFRLAGVQARSSDHLERVQTRIDEWKRAGVLAAEGGYLATGPGIENLPPVIWWGR